MGSEKSEPFYLNDQAHILSVGQGMVLKGPILHLAQTGVATFLANLFSTWDGVNGISLTLSCCSCEGGTTL